jgi:hypothetical protein
MADYYPLIARAVAGLDKNTGDARRALYERARAALVAQLRGVTPVLEESDVTRERLALEEAIRKVEGESSRQATRGGETAARVKVPEFPRWEAPPPPAPEPEPEPPAKPARRPQPPARQDGRALQDGRAAPASGSARPNKSAERRLPEISYDPSSSADSARADPPRRPQPPRPDAASASGRPKSEPRPIQAPDDEGELEQEQPRAAARTRPGSERPDRRSLLDSGKRIFRDVVSEANDLGGASARATRSARENLAAVPPPAADGARTRRPLDSDEAYLTLEDITDPVMLEPSFIVDESRPSPPRSRQAPPAAQPERAPRTPRNYGDLIRIAIAAVLVIGIGGLFIWQWPNMVAIYGMLTAPAQQAEVPDQPAPAPVPPTTRKDPGRFESAGSSSQQATPDPAAVAQHVVLYEEDPNDPKGKQSIGSAIWRTEAVSPGTGKPPELAVRADIEIPERKISITWTLRRDMEPNSSTSHTIEIMFKLPPDFPAGGIQNVPGIFLKQAEQAPGTALDGLAVKVTTGYFLIGLSSAAAVRDRNIQLLKERPWFDIPIVYNNNRRALLALEKGTPGDRAFTQAFAAWGK